jgi:putative pyruvate formate lyase activating enzyme
VPKIQNQNAADTQKDSALKKSLNRYFAIGQNKRQARFQISKRIAAEFSEEDSTAQLWKEHARLIQEFSIIQRKIDSGKIGFQALPVQEKSYLDLKIKIAERILKNCQMCSRRCGVNRLVGEIGYCGCGREINVSCMFMHTGEEPELVPSGTIFTMGCTMRCKHCQNWTISQWVEKGQIYSIHDLAYEIEKLHSRGCRNANLVGGEPTPWIHQWLETFKYVESNIPVVWNSNSYYSPECAVLLSGFADVYLLDFKYGPGFCATEISESPGFWKTCLYNGSEAKKCGELIIRTLVLPNHLECCTRPIIDWIARNLGVDTRVNLMFQYRPEWKATENADLNRRLTDTEIQRARQIARNANLRNIIC